jgi:hypothetical protein
MPDQEGRIAITVEAVLRPSIVTTTFTVLPVSTPGGSAIKT